MARPNLVNSKTIFLSTIIVVPLLTLIIYLEGLHYHRTIYLNSLLSTSLVSVVFLIFITTGLYRGWKLKDELGDFSSGHKKNWPPEADMSMDISGFPTGLADMTETGPIGCLLSIVIWIVMALFGSLILWLFGAFFWSVILAVGAILYWIIFRAFRLIFRNSAKCKSNLLKSFGYGLLYTILYNCWIYAIIFGTHFLDENFRNLM